MSASFVSGFWMVLISAAAAAYSKVGNLTGKCLFDLFLLFSVLANIVFFYSFGLVAEQNIKYHAFIRKRGDGEWYIRVLSNVVLLVIPLALEYGVRAFGISIVLFYVTLILWDFVVFGGAGVETREPGFTNPILFDLFGFILSIVMLLVLWLYSEPPNSNLVLIGQDYLLFFIAVLSTCFYFIAGLSLTKAWPALQELLRGERI